MIKDLEMNKENLILMNTLYYDDNNPSLLIKAIKTCNTELALKLIEYEIGLMAKDNEGNNALILSIIYQNQILFDILSDKINIEEEGMRKHTPLTISAKIGFYYAFEKLLLKNANIQHLTDNQSNALIYCAAYGNDKIAELLIKRMNNLNHKNNEGNSALLYASKHGHFNIVKMLIENGADINIIDKNYENSLMLAVKGNHNKIVEFLINNDINLNHKSGMCFSQYTAFDLVYKLGYSELLKFFNDKNKHSESYLGLD